MNLRVAQIVADTDAEGPGRRFALWVQGCAIRCPGCCNPEMFNARGGRVAAVAELVALVEATAGIEGVTVLGGEPFEQADGVGAFAEGVRALGLSVMVFTGHVVEELRGRADPGVDRLLAATDLLVDGPYLRDQPEDGRRWIGSTNQRYHFLTGRYSLTEPRFWSGNTVEIRVEKGRIMVNGWPAGAEALGLRRR
jgi:anaerobic ribonucleoside-triphosphate reductase activating protein